MFRDKVFNLSLLFSGLWHLFWIFAIAIVATPTVQTTNVYQEVDFLGPILEKTAFDLMVEIAETTRPQAETIYAGSMSFLNDNLHLKPEGPQRRVLKEFLSDGMRDRFSVSLREYLKEDKEIPYDFAAVVKTSHTLFEKKETFSLVEGPAKERDIIFRPVKLTIPQGLYGDGKEYVIKLKFFVSNDGMVYDVKPVVSSGYPEIDLQAIRFLKRWKFAPSDRAGGDTAWGFTTVKAIAE